MKKYYMLLGSNNFWYGQLSSLEDVEERIKDIKKNPGFYTNPETGYSPELPSELYVFEKCSERKVIKMM